MMKWLENFDDSDAEMTAEEHFKNMIIEVSIFMEHRKHLYHILDNERDKDYREILKNIV